MGKSQPRAGASRTGPVTLARLQSSALREWDRLVGALATARRDPRRLGPWTLQVVRLAAKIVVVALLPFLALVRVAVFLYEHEGWPTVLALAGGTACTAAVVTAYGAWAWHRLTGQVRLALVGRRIALPFVVAYSIYALVYLSSANAKSDRVRAYYASLHPLLRVGLSTLIVFDRDAVQLYLWGLGFSTLRHTGTSDHLHVELPVR